MSTLQESMNRVLVRVATSMTKSLRGHSVMSNLIGDFYYYSANQEKILHRIALANPDLHHFKNYALIEGKIVLYTSYRHVEFDHTKYFPDSVFLGRGHTKCRGAKYGSGALIPRRKYLEL